MEYYSFEDLKPYLLKLDIRSARNYKSKIHILKEELFKKLLYNDLSRYKDYVNLQKSMFASKQEHIDIINKYNIGSKLEYKIFKPELEKKIKKFLFSKPDEKFNFSWSKEIYFSSFKSSNIENFIKSELSIILNKKIDSIQNYKGISEMDIFIPEYKISIEYDGYFFHKNRKIKDLNKYITIYNNSITPINIREIKNINPLRISHNDIFFKWSNNDNDFKELILNILQKIISITNDKKLFKLYLTYKDNDCILTNISYILNMRKGINIEEVIDKIKEISKIEKIYYQSHFLLNFTYFKKKYKLSFSKIEAKQTIKEYNLFPKKEFLNNYNLFKKVCRQYNLLTEEQYLKNYKNIKYDNLYLPSNPHKFFKKWISWYDIKFFSLEEIKKILPKDINTHKKWRKFRKESNYKNNIPIEHQYFFKKDWKGFNQFYN